MKQVTILMATYDPNLDWLDKQLQSLNEQTYKNLKLILLDDCSPTVSLKDIERAIKKNITAFSYEIYQNEHNLGSCKSFERLTAIGEGEYFAYCDQDDIWEKNKIERLMAVIKPETSLIYADLSIINQDGIKTHDSLRDIRKRLKHREGYGLEKVILFRNFITGCTMIVKAEIAKASIPFTSEMIGDHHLALYAATKGMIQYLDEPLVRYRQHESNVTGILKGVQNKKDYIDVRVLPLISQFNKLKITFKDNGKMIRHIDKGLVWLKAREQYLKGKFMYAFVILWYSGFNFKTSGFDLMIPFMSKSVFEKVLGRIRGESA